MREKRILKMTSMILILYLQNHKRKKREKEGEKIKKQLKRLLKKKMKTITLKK